MMEYPLTIAFEFVSEIPKTAAGKFRKTALRERFATRREVTPAC